MTGRPQFTVFTPTYNRAHTIQRVFDSLRAQTLRDFEWLVVDDGSTDGTAQLIAGWIASADFPIRYLRQDHFGKHFAHNLAIRHARGDFFMLLDSDDSCVPDALEKILKYWNTIPVTERAEFVSVVGLCRNQHGDIIGDRFPSDPFDATLRERHYVHRLRGEKGGAARLDVLRKFPFPEVVNTQFVPEGAVWLEVGKTYKARCVNEVFRIYHVSDANAGETLTKRTNLGQNATGRLHYYVWILNNDLDYFFYAPLPFLKAAVMIPVAALYAGRSLVDICRSLHRNFARFLVLATLPFSLLLFVADRLRTFGSRHKVVASP